MKILDTPLYSSLTRLQWMSSADRAMVSGKDGYHKITECLRWEGTSHGHLVQLLPWQGHLKQAAYGHVSKEVSHLSGLSHPHRLSASSCSDGPSCVSVGAHHLWSSHWAPMKSTWLHLLLQPPFRVFVHIAEIFPEPFVLQAAQFLLSLPWDLLQ